MEYYGAIEKNDIFPPAAKWTQMEDFILSEGRQTQNEAYHIISYNNVWEVKFQKQPKRQKRPLDIGITTDIFL